MFEMNKEEWRVVAGYPRYEASSSGQIRNRETGRVLRPGLEKHGYLIAVLCSETGQRKAHSMHRLMAKTFLPPDDTRKYVDHINGTRTDNRVENLRWATNSENLHNRSRLNRNNTSGVPGVYWNKREKKWQAQIPINGRNKHLGYYSSREEARAARVGAARLLFGEYCSAIEKEETPPM